MKVQTRNPLFRVRIVTRELGEFTFDQTHGSVTRITTRKRLGDPAGSFELSFVPRVPPQRLFSVPAGLGWEDCIEQMDFCELWFWVPPRLPLHPVMRGFVDNVGKEFDIGSGIPEIRIVITGRDYGKLLILTKIWDPLSDAESPEIFKKFQAAQYTTFGWSTSDATVGPPPEHPPMAAGAVTEGPSFTPNQMLAKIFNGFYVPQENEILGTFNDPVPSMSFAAFTDSSDNLRTLSPTFWQRGTIPFTDVWSLMSAYQHKPWRELFVLDAFTVGPVLVYRPTPWLDLQGQFVQDIGGLPLTTWPIHNTDIISSTTMRSEQQLLNLFFTYPEMYAGFAAIVKDNPHSLEGYALQWMFGNPYLVGFQNPQIQFSDYRRFGFRLAEFSTPYLDWEQKLPQSTLPGQIADSRQQGFEWNMRAVRAFDHNHELESGQLTLKGDERIQIGDYLSLEDEASVFPGVTTGAPRCYIEGVTQVFQQGTRPTDGHFITQIEFSRGRRHLSAKYFLKG